MKKIGSLLLALSLIFSMSISTVNAEEMGDIMAPPQSFITVIDNTVSPAKTHEITFEQFESWSTTKGHNFSGINNQGTVKIEKNVKGINVESLLKKLKVKTKKVKSITFGVDRDGLTFNWSKLFQKRYYYSKLDKFNAVKGKTLSSKAKKNRKVVKPLITNDGDEAKLYLGQSYASERNWPNFWNFNVITLNKKSIKVTRYSKPRITSKKFRVGEAISFKSLSQKDNDGFIYYTVNGKYPNEKNSFIYNCEPKIDGINAKIFKKKGTYTVKAMVNGFSKKSSKVLTIKVKVLSAKSNNNNNQDTVLPDDIN